MIETIILDLSEVLIAGIVGVDRALARRLAIPEAEVVGTLGGARFLDLLRGKVSEDAYLQATIQEHGWDIAPDEVKRLLRDNFCHEVPGMVALVDELAGRFEVVLLTDHGREWMAHILAVHPFLARFHRRFTSYELGRIKIDPGTFETVLAAIGRPPGACLFVDDNPRNVDAARAAGIAAIVFRSAGQLRAELVRLALLDA